MDLKCIAGIQYQAGDFKATLKTLGQQNDIVSLMLRGKAAFNARRFNSAEADLVRAKGLLMSVTNSTKPELERHITKWIEKSKTSTRSDDETDKDADLNTIAP